MPPVAPPAREPEEILRIELMKGACLTHVKVESDVQMCCPGGGHSAGLETPRNPILDLTVSRWRATRNPGRLAMNRLRLPDGHSKS